MESVTRVRCRAKSPAEEEPLHRSVVFECVINQKSECGGKKKDGLLIKNIIQNDEEPRGNIFKYQYRSGPLGLIHSALRLV